MLVLRIDQGIRKRTDTRAHSAQDRVRDLLAGRPEICRHNLPSTGDHGVSETDLAVQLEGAGLHSERARRRPRS